MRFIALATALFLANLALVPTATAADGKPPVELFFKNPKFTQVTISPSGRYIAALAPPPGNARRNIMVLDLQTKQRWFATGLNKDDIVGYFWKTDDRIVFVLDNAGNENFGLYSVKTKQGSPIEDLIGESVLKKLGAFRRAAVLDGLIDEPKHILITFNKRDVFAADLYKLNVENGKLDMIARNPGKFQGWLTDHKGAVRVAYEIDGLKTRTLYRSNADADWQTLNESVYPAADWAPARADSSPRAALAASDRAGSEAVGSAASARPPTCNRSARFPPKRTRCSSSRRTALASVMSRKAAAPMPSSCCTTRAGTSRTSGSGQVSCRRSCACRPSASSRWTCVGTAGATSRRSR